MLQSWRALHLVWKLVIGLAAGISAISGAIVATHHAWGALGLPVYVTQSFMLSENAKLLAEIEKLNNRMVAEITNLKTESVEIRLAGLDRDTRQLSFDRYTKQQALARSGITASERTLLAEALIQIDANIASNDRRKVQLERLKDGLGQ